jgi:hypothetical protein
MGDLIDFPGPHRSEMMPGHKIDLLRVRQVLLDLVAEYGSESKEMWDEFDRRMKTMVIGFFAHSVTRILGGREVSVICLTPEGKFQSSVYVLNSQLKS